MSLLKKLTSQTVIYGLPTILGRFLNFLLVSLHTRALPTVSDYGVVGELFAYASLAAVVFTFGMETAFFNFARKAENPRKVFSTATWSVIIVAAILLLLSWLFQQPIMAKIGYPQKPYLLFWFGMILAADAVTAMCFAWLRFAEKPGKYAAIRSLNIFINIALNLFFLVYCPAHANESWIQSFYKPEKMVDYIFLSNLFASLIILPLFFKSLSELKNGIENKLLKQMIKYGAPMVIIGTAGMINETFDRILIKKLLPQDIAGVENGIYNAYYKLSLIITLFIQAFRMAAEPLFFKQADEKNAPQNYARIMKWFVYFCGFAAIFTMVFLPLLSHLLLGESFRNNPRGLQVVPILLIANIFLGIYYNISVWYKINNRILSGAYISLAAAFITIVLNFIFIPKFSFIACAYTTLIAYLFMTIVGYVWGAKIYPIPYPVWTILLIIFFTALIIFNLQNFSSMLNWISIPLYLFLIFVIEKTPKLQQH